MKIIELPVLFVTDPESAELSDGNLQKLISAFCYVNLDLISMIQEHFDNPEFSLVSLSVGEEGRLVVAMSPKELVKLIETETAK